MSLKWSSNKMAYMRIPYADGFVLPVWSYLTYMQSEMTCVVLIRLGNGMIEHLAEYLTMEASISKAENDVSSDGDNSGELARC